MSYMEKWRINEQQAAQVVVKNRRNGVKNPFAHLRNPVSKDEVLNSEMLSTPLRKLHLPPFSDGACALVLARDEMVNPSQQNVAWIEGIGWAQDTYYMGDKELASLDSLSKAAVSAYQMAGIKDPLKDLDLAEIHDITAYHEMMAYEALGFCEQGKGGEFIERGHPLVGGKVAVNPSGGALCSNPYSSVGLIRIAETALQIMGKAGDTQIDKAECALGHGISGMAGQSHCVAILAN
jgi:acetyl-CoA C-acetyltransferase